MTGILESLDYRWCRGSGNPAVVGSDIYLDNSRPWQCYVVYHVS
jgi:hypothetical protein